MGAFTNRVGKPFNDPYGAPMSGNEQGPGRTTEMITSDDLHPTRWARNRPFSRQAIDLFRRVFENPGSLDAQRVQDTFQTLTQAMTAHYNDGILRVPVERRPKDIRMMKGELDLAMQAVAWHHRGRNAFVLSDGLHAALRRTDLKGVRFGDVKLPFPSFYISLANRFDRGLVGSDNVIDGAYVSGGEGRIHICLTTRRQDAGARSSRNWPFSRDPYFDVPLKAHANETFEDLLQAAIATREIDLVGETYLPDGWVDGPVDVDGHMVHVTHNTTRRGEEARDRQEDLPVVRQALALIVNTLAWLTIKPQDSTSLPEWTSDAHGRAVAQSREGSKGKRQQAVAELLQGGFARIRIAGRELDAERDLRPSEGDGSELQESHWRIGHWRRQPHGEGLLLRRLQWVRPTLVRPDLGPPSTGRIYDVGPDEDEPSAPGP
jgi:hypothetical protein